MVGGRYRSAVLLFGLMVAAVISPRAAVAQSVRTWNVTSGTWATTGSWLGGTAPGSTDTALFSSSGVGSSNVTALLGADVTIAGLSFSSAGSTTLQSNTSTARTVTLNASGIAIGVGAGAVTIGASGSTVNLTTGTAQTWTNDSSNTLSVLGTINLNNQSLTVAGAGATTLSGAISGGSGRLTKSGSGTLTLTAANSYTGTTSVNAGTLQVGNNGTTGSLATSSVITGSAGATLAFNRTNTVTQGTDFASAIGGAINVTQLGSGTLVLAGANTYTGTTSVNAGTLQVGNNGTTGSLATSSVITGSAGGTLVFNRTNTVTQGTDFASAIGGAINVTQLGSGTLVLLGTNTYTGTTSVNAGTLQIGNGGTAGALAASGVITGSAGATLVFNRTNTVTQGSDFGSVIGGAINVTKRGTGALVLNGANTYTGTTTLTGGTTTISGASGSLGGTTVVAVYGNSATSRTATLVVDNTAANSNDRINNAANVILGQGSSVAQWGGQLRLVGNGSTTETINQLQLFGGASTISATGGVVLTAAGGFLRTVGSNTSTSTYLQKPVVNFDGGGALGTTNKVILTGYAPAGSTYMGGWAYADNNDFAVYDATNGVKAMTSGAGSGDYAQGTSLTANRVNSLTASATQNSAITLFGLKLANGANLSGSGTLAFSADADGKMPGLIAVGSSTIANPIALGTSAVANSEFLVRVADPAGTLTLSGLITGGNGSFGDSIRPIVKSGEGRLVLRNQSSTSGWAGGGLLIDEGVVRVDGGSFAPGGSSPKSVVIMPGTTLELSNGAAVGASNNDHALGGTLRSISGTNTFGAIGSIFGSPTIQVDSGTLTITSANFSGSGTLTLTGSGNGFFNGMGNIINTTILNAGSGTWAFNSSNDKGPNGQLLQSATGPMLLNSRTVLTGTSTNANYANNRLQADANGYVGANYANPRQGDTSSSANYDFIAAFNKAATLGTIGIDGGNTFSGASLDLTGFGSTARLGSTTTGTISGTTTITPQGDTFRFGGGGGVLTVGSVLADGTAARGLNMGTSGALAAGTLLLTGSSTFSGDTVITAGTLRIGVAGALPSGSGKGNLVFDTPANAAILDLNGFGTTVNGLSGGSSATTMVINSGTGTTSTLTVGGNDATSTFGGVLADNSGTGGTLALTKIGTGTFTLSGSSGYSGATTISAGRLEVSSGGRINGSSGITINGSGAELKYNSATALAVPITFTQGTISGTGTIGTAVTVGASDVISPGNSPGIQAYTSGLTWASGGTYLWEINDWNGTAGDVNNGFDQVQVSGGNLVVSSSASAPFTIRITGLTGGNAVGVVPNFSSGNVGRSFVIATGTPSGMTTTNVVVDGTTAFTPSNPLPAGAGFWLSQTGSSVILNYAPSARYSLTGSASATAIRTGSSTTLTATITSSTAAVTNPDSLGYTGLSLLGGAGALSSTSGTIAGGASGSGSVSYSNNIAGQYTFTPSITSGTNVNIGTTAIATATTGVTVTVYNPASANSLPTSLSFGNIYTTGSFNSQQLSIWNTGAAATAFQEGLNATISGSIGNATASGSITNLYVTGGTSTAISLGLTNSGSAGVRSGNVTLGFASNGTLSGLSDLTLASQSVALSGTVYNMAAAAATQTVNVGNFHVGDTATKSFSLANTAPVNATYTETLGSGSFSSTTSGFTTAGSVTGIAGGSSGTGSLQVGFNTATAGNRSGSTVLSLNSEAVNGSGLGTAGFSSQTITITGGVYNLASAGAVSGTINFGTVLKNTALSQNLSITNTAPMGNYTEKLDAAFGSFTGLASGSGSVSLLAAGGTSSAMSFYLASGSAGLALGTAQIAFTSNGAGTSELGTTSLSAQTVSLLATVLDPALPSWTNWTSGSASSALLLISLGEHNQGTGSVSQTFNIWNLLQTAGYTADLDLISITPDGGNLGSITTDLATFTGLASGTYSPFTASLSLGTLGNYSSTWTLGFTSSKNGTQFNDSPRNLTLQVTGVIVVPEPGAIALAGVGIAVAGWAIWNRRRRSVSARQ